MACDCIEKITQKMADHVQKQNPQFVITDANFLQKGFSLGGGGYHPYNEIKIEYMYPKKDGSMSRETSMKISAYGEYCQFCGKKYKTASEKEAQYVV